MDKLNDIVIAAKECYEKIKGVCTTEELIALRRVGISESDISMVDIDGNGMNEVDLHEYAPDTPIYGFRLESYVASNDCRIDFPTLNTAADGSKERFYFDVYDIDEEGDIFATIEDATLDTIEGMYNAYMAENYFYVTNIKWDLSDEDTNEDEIRSELKEYLHGACIAGYITKSDMSEVLDNFDDWVKISKPGEVYYYDGCEYKYDYCPIDVELPEETFISKDATIEEEIADYLSDKYGWCVESYLVENSGEKSKKDLLRLTEEKIQEKKNDAFADDIEVLLLNTLKAYLEKDIAEEVA